MAKRTSWAGWGLAALLAVALGGGGAYAVAQFLSLRGDLQRWSLDEHLRQAALMGDLGAVRVLLAQGANVNAGDERGSTALHMAVERDAPDIVRVLLARGARVNVVDWYGETPLMTAAGAGSIGMVSVLLRHSADPNAKDRSGGTALTRATAEHHPAVVPLLKEAGAKR